MVCSCSYARVIHFVWPESNDRRDIAQPVVAVDDGEAFASRTVTARKPNQSLVKRTELNSEREAAG